MGKRLLVFLCLFLFFTVNLNRSDNNRGLSQPAVQETENSELSLSLEAYKSVLANEASFINTVDNKKVYLKDFLVSPLKVLNFTVIDMDGDTIPEAVLELTMNEEWPFSVEVLHYKNGEVYGYNFTFRALMQLKTDGTFTFSSGAFDYGYGKLHFESNKSETDKTGYTESSYNNDTLIRSFFINHNPVTEEEFKTFEKKQNEKEDVTWYEFTQDNVEKELSFYQK
jgi:formylglycine-generating enzyme required for sulfatase activity